jgi:hypothetical protein
MRYPRKPFRFAGTDQEANIMAVKHGAEKNEATHEPDEALAAA